MVSPDRDTRSALNMLSTNVVIANAARPSGPGSAMTIPPGRDSTTSGLRAASRETGPAVAGL
jgi:hypothetical protein